MATELIVLSCLLTVSQAHFIDVDRPLDSFRIIGGSDAKPGEFPHMISLGYADLEYGFSNHCGGSIISNKWILTAAHCVRGFDTKSSVLSIRAGTSNIEEYEENMQQVEVASIFIHEHYISHDDRAGDIGLIKLKSPLKFNKYVAPVNLPKKNTEPTGAVIFSGWGRISTNKSVKSPTILQKVNLMIVDRKTCNEAVIKILKERKAKTKENEIDTKEICSGPVNSGLSICYGDSGSALVRKDAKGTTEVVGIATWAIIPCGTIGAPSVYTKVSSYIDWIENTMSNN